MSTTKTISVDVDVDLDDFDEDDIVEYLEGCGYTVTSDAEKNKVTNAFHGCSYELMNHDADRVKQILESHCYDPQFVRFMLCEIADLPMGSSRESVLAKLQEMM